MPEIRLQRCERRLLRDCGGFELEPDVGETPRALEEVLRERLDSDLADFLVAALPVLFESPSWIDRRSRGALVRDHRSP